MSAPETRPAYALSDDFDTGYIDPGLSFGEAWHWHDQAELMLVTQGGARLSAGPRRADLSAGDCVFVAPGCVHRCAPRLDGRVRRVAFRLSWIAPEGTALYERYIGAYYPHRLPGVTVVTRADPDQGELAALINQIASFPMERFDAPLRCRNLVSALWLVLLRRASEWPLTSLQERRGVGEARLRDMLGYMRAHFADSLTVDQVARAASVSRSECFRCFKQTIDQRPVDILNEYRVLRAADILAHGDTHIAQIGYDCGFSSPSYFGKVFRALTGMTPQAYRRTQSSPNSK